MNIKSLICLSLLAVGCAAPMWADDACPEEYATRFPAKNLQTPDYIRLYKALPPALQQELCRKDNTDWKPTADESAPRPLWDLFLNVLCVSECGQPQVLCTPDDNRILQVSYDAFGAIYCYVDVYTRQADGLWAKTNHFGFATRNVEFGKVIADNESVTVEFVDKKLDLVIPERVPFSKEENYIGYRLDREQAWGGEFTPLTNEIYPGNVEHIRLMLESGKVDAEEKDGWGLTPLEYTDPARFAETFPESEPLPHSGEIRELLLRHIEKGAAEFVKNHPAEETAAPKPGDPHYTLRTYFFRSNPGVVVCTEGATGKVLYADPSRNIPVGSTVRLREPDDATCGGATPVLSGEKWLVLQAPVKSLGDGVYECMLDNLDHVDGAGLVVYDGADMPESWRKVRDLICQEMAKAHPGSIVTGAEETVPAGYRLCKEWPGGKEGISLCLYEIQGPGSATSSVLRFRRDATGMLLREARPHISRHTQGHIPEMAAPELVWVPESMGLGRNILLVYESGRVRTPFAILELEWGSDCQPSESATLPPEGLPILSPLYQGMVGGCRNHHVLRQDGDKVFVDFYADGDSPETGSTPNASFFIGTIPPPKG